MEEEIGKLSIEMDSNSLFKETVYTDRKSGSIKMLEKINVQTNTVASDEKLFIGETQIMTPMGALPINFEIPAKTINEAVGEFGNSAKIAINKAVEEIKEMKRKAASSIVVPGQENMNMAENLMGNKGPIIK